MKKILLTLVIGVIAAFGMGATGVAQAFSAYPNTPTLAPPPQQIWTSTTFNAQLEDIYGIQTYDELFAGDYMGGASIYGIHTVNNPLTIRHCASGAYVFAQYPTAPCSGYPNNGVYVAFSYSQNVTHTFGPYPCLLAGAHWWGHRTRYRVDRGGGWGAWYWTVDSGGNYGAVC